MNNQYEDEVDTDEHLIEIKQITDNLKNHIGAINDSLS